MASNSELIAQRISELKRQYEQAERQLINLQNTIGNLEKYASYVVQTGDFIGKHVRMSNEAWQKRASDTIKELIKIDKKSYPTCHSVLVPIYTKLRNVYGVVFDQLRKDYKYKYDTLLYPSVFEAISDDDTIRSIFDSLLLDMFPVDYNKGDVLESVEGDGKTVRADESPAETIIKLIAPLAIRTNDDSYGYTRTFNMVCDSMGCSWGNLQTRYMHTHSLKTTPSKQDIVVGNENVYKKFKKAVRTMLANCTIP